MWAIVGFDCFNKCKYLCDNNKVKRWNGLKVMLIIQDISNVCGGRAQGLYFIKANEKCVWGPKPHKWMLVPL